MLSSVLCKEFLLHILCWLYFFNRLSFSSTSPAGFIFVWGVSLTHPVLASFLCGVFLLLILSWLHFLCREFPLHIPCVFCFFFFFFFFLIWGVSLTHPVLALFFRGVFLLHIPCLLDFSVESFSYTSHPSVCFSLFILFFIIFYLGSFSYTSRAGFLMWGVSLTHAVLAS